MARRCVSQQEPTQWPSPPWIDTTHGQAEVGGRPAASPSRSDSRIARAGGRTAARACSAAIVATIVSMSRSKSPLVCSPICSRPITVDARHGRRRAAAVDAGAERVAAILADHRHVVAGPHEFAQQVHGVDAHARDGREEAPADEADPHASASTRLAGRLGSGATACSGGTGEEREASGIIRSARWLSRDSSTQTRPAEADAVERLEHGRHVHVALAEGQVDVLAAPHVLDRDGADAAALNSAMAAAGSRSPVTSRWPVSSASCRPGRSAASRR